MPFDRRRVAAAIRAFERGEGGLGAQTLKGLGIASRERHHVALEGLGIRIFRTTIV